MLCMKWLTGAGISVSRLLYLLWSMSLCLRGNTIISQRIHPSVPPSCPGAPRATPNPRTLHPPWDETWPRAPLSPPWSLHGAAGFDSSYRASIQPEIKPWWENTGLDRQIDGSTSSGVDTWWAGELMHPDQVEGTLKTSTGTSGHE